MANERKGRILVLPRVGTESRRGAPYSWIVWNSVHVFAVNRLICQTVEACPLSLSDRTIVIILYARNVSSSTFP